MDRYNERTVHAVIAGKPIQHVHVSIYVTYTCVLEGSADSQHEGLWFKPQQDLSVCSSPTDLDVDLDE